MDGIDRLGEWWLLGALPKRGGGGGRGARGMGIGCLAPRAPATCLRTVVVVDGMNRLGDALMLDIMWLSLGALSKWQHGKEAGGESSRRGGRD